MMTSDAEYLQNYIPDTLYVHPGREGAYATLVVEGETSLAEIEVTPRSWLAVSVFYINDKKNFGTFKLTKLRFHKTYGWQEDGSLQVNNFQLSHLKHFVSLLAALDLRDAKKGRIGLNNIQIETLKTLLPSETAFNPIF
ncbi:hypothetical protein BH10PSE7_BH10PSE7_23770 [soil metagenome]